MLRLIILASASVLTTAAHAQQCDSYANQTIQAVAFDQALTQLPRVAPKGEFETTAQYEARRAAASGGGAGPLIILKTPEDRDAHIRYDADTGRLGIKSYAFNNMGFDAWSALYGTPYAAQLNPSTLGNLDVVISQTEKPTGTYMAKNAYGATWEVVKLNRTIQAIYEGPLKGGSFTSSLFSQADKAPYMVGYLTMPPEVAQRIKPTLKLAYVVAPREPFVIKKTYEGSGRITMQNPRDVTNNATILVGDIQCGLVLDAANRVLGAYPTR